MSVFVFVFFLSLRARLNRVQIFFLAQSLNSKVNLCNLLTHDNKGTKKMKIRSLLRDFKWGFCNGIIWENDFKGGME